MPESETAAPPPPTAPRPGVFYLFRAHPKAFGLGVLIVAVTSGLGFLSLSTHKPRRKKTPVAVTPAQTSDFDQEESSAAKERRLALITGTNPIAVAEARNKNKSSHDPETAKIDKQMDELAESMDNFTPTSSLPRSPAADPAPDPGSGPATAEKKSRQAQTPKIQNSYGMSGGISRSFDSLRFKSQQKAPAKEGSADGPVPLFGGAIGQAKSLANTGEVPSAEASAAAAPPKEEPGPFDFGPEWLREGGKRVQAWSRRLASGRWGRISGFIWKKEPGKSGAEPKMNLLGRALYKVRGPRETGLGLPEQGVAVSARTSAPAAPAVAGRAAPPPAAIAPQAKPFPRRKVDRRAAMAVVATGAGLALALHLGIGGIVPKVQPKLAKGSLALMGCGAALLAFGFPKTGMASIATGSALLALDKKLAARLAG